MKKTDALAALTALAQETRLDIFRHLVQVGAPGLPAGQLAEHLRLPAATLSFHLNTLKQGGLLCCRRQGRSLIYSADYGAMNGLLAYLTENCCAGQTGLCPAPDCVEPTDPSHGNPTMPEPAYNVLFLCTGNSARSILAEAILNHQGKGRFRAYSAGSHPTGRVNPLALKLLEYLGLDTAGLRSKSWDEFAVLDAPRLDFVFTVCDNAAGEVCPVWLGQPMTAHWGLPDPAGVEGSEVEKMQAFQDVFRVLERRIGSFASLRPEALDRIRLKDHLDAIGRE